MTILLLQSGPGAGGGGGAGPSGHRYWRILLMNSASTAYGFAEVQFRTTAGTSLPFSGGTASAGQTFGGTPGANDASKAADGNTTTFYSSSDKTGSQFWAYDLGAGNSRNVVEVTITARNDASYLQAPSNFALQWSDDGSAWTSMAPVTGLWTSAGQTLTFSSFSPAASLVTFNGAATSATLSNGNLTATRNETSGAGAGARSASLKSSGKYYYEITYGASHGNSDGYGMLMPIGDYTNQMNGQNCLTVFTNFGPGNIYSNGSASGSLSTSFVAGDVVCFAIDLDNLKGYIRKNNGNWNNSGTANPATNTGGITLAAASYAPSIAWGNAGSVAGDNATGNFGQTAYSFAVPAGFGSWPL